MTDKDFQRIVQYISTDECIQNINNEDFKSSSSSSRPGKNQPLLAQIIEILEYTCRPLPCEEEQKSTSILQTHVKQRKIEDGSTHEPAFNIENTLRKLKQITSGHYSIKTQKTAVASQNAEPELNSVFYNESLYYLISFGRHIDVLRFLMKHKLLSRALRYTVLLRIPCDCFLQSIIKPYLKSGRLSQVLQKMIDIDGTLFIWRDYLVQTCLLLEKNKLYGSLYQVQLLTKDFLRASMTCVHHFYKKATTYLELHKNTVHLTNAQIALENELQLEQWEDLQQSKCKNDTPTFIMKKSPKCINQQLTAISLQIDATKFLMQCETSGEHGKNITHIISQVRFFFFELISYVEIIW